MSIFDVCDELFSDRFNDGTHVIKMLCNITAHLFDTVAMQSCNKILCNYFAKSNV